MIILDTCALIYDALTPERLSKKAARIIEEEGGRLACSDISLWEVAMLIAKGRLDPGTDTLSFIRLALAARPIQVIPITPEIAALSATHDGFSHFDPADRLIAATTLQCRGKLVTCDQHLHKVKGLPVIW
ncbi:type II toxin-antitoxin system VapC family toxin [Geobacter sp.]|uniref:type II toxin-antitoxin system VapC family toxin n=1 Tax=Geobacter sp. TaxID=46610 RepID=UPI002629F711|nr:type II toxin-antitoxin system VapC family toxin [Geobacter sp.]